MCGYFFFKQKTAYEMRIGDWSSDVCSSDLIGQGTSSTLAMIACDELGADWSKTRFELATGLPEYRNMLLGQPGQLYAGEQVTGGSTVTAGFFMPVRTAAAQMREMLTLAAAQKWDIGRAHV